MNLFNKVLENKLNIFYFLFPLISGYIAVALCPMKKNEESNVKFRPPGYIFSIVWPILYLMIGYAWTHEKKNSLWYFLLSLSLAYWLVVYSCQNNKLLAIGVIFISILLTLVCYTLSKQLSKLLLLPLLVWLIFAALLSTFSVSKIH